MPIILKRAIFSCSIARRSFSGKPVGIVGAPFCKGTGKVSSGVQDGPSALRERGLIQAIQEMGLEAKDYGNIVLDELEENKGFGKAKFPVNVSTACQKLSNVVKTILEDDRRCLTIGGDHSLAMGTVYGHSQVHDQLSVLWVDTHTDINTEFTSTTGHIHGMPCSFFLKELQKYRKESSMFKWLQPCLSTKNIAYIGCHDIDPMEKLILEKEGIVHYTMYDIDRLGIIEVTNRALDAINPTGNRSLHVSFDVDSLDKTIVPCTTVPRYGGLTLREVLCVAEEICKRGFPTAVDVVEIDPSKATEEQTRSALDIILIITKAFLGFSRCGVLPRDRKQIPTE